MLKFRYAVIITLLTVIALIIGACGRKGNHSPNQRPTISITSYDGVVDSTTIDPDAPIAFQQQIFWEASDADGRIEGYAFRVTDEFGHPLTDDDDNVVGVPGYEVVDDQGWVYHYQSGADESIPLEDSDAKTIWTNQIYAVINFPAADAAGDSIPTTSIFEVKCIDNDEQQCEENAQKYYYANSEVPECNISSTKGDVNHQTVGTGVVFTFNIMDNDQFVGNIPDHYEFMFEKRFLTGDEIYGDEGYAQDEDSKKWWSTKDFENIDEIFVSLDDEDGNRPAMKLNSLINGVAQDSTYMIAKAIDLAGIVSEPDTITFIVKEGFYPGTLIYNNKKDGDNTGANDIFILGSNHFYTYNPYGQIIPSTLTAEGYHYSTPFFIDQEANFTCIHSNDLKIYMHWGYLGEYEQNNPNEKPVSSVLDEQTNALYYSDIKYFDLRLDGEPYFYAPLPASEYNYLDEETGKEWLRVPFSYEIAQETVLLGLEPGLHRFEVRAVDLQNAPDETPADFTFNIVEPIPIEDKEGILVVYDMPNSGLAPFDEIQSFYEESLDDYPGTVDFLNRNELSDQQLEWGLSTHSDVLSPSDLQNYKTVIYVSDVPSNPGESKFHLEYDVLNLFMRNGGNLILSAGANLDFKIQVGMINSALPFFDVYAGVDSDEDEAIEAFASVYQPVPNISYFVEAIAEENSSYNDIELQLPSFNYYVNLTETLAPVAYFNPEYLSESVEVLYRFGSIQPGDEPGQPSQNEYNFYTSKPVAIKKTTGNSKCYFFSFPLAFMNVDQAKTAIMQIINEIEE